MSSYMCVVSVCVRVNDRRVNVATRSVGLALVRVCRSASHVFTLNKTVAVSQSARPITTSMTLPPPRTVPSEGQPNANGATLAVSRALHPLPVIA